MSSQLDFRSYNIAIKTSNTFSRLKCYQRTLIQEMDHDLVLNSLNTEFHVQTVKIFEKKILFSVKDTKLTWKPEFINFNF